MWCHMMWKWKPSRITNCIEYSRYYGMYDVFSTKTLTAILRLWVTIRDAPSSTSASTCCRLCTSGWWYRSTECIPALVGSVLLWLVLLSRYLVSGMAKYYEILPNAGNFEIWQINFRLNLPLWRVKRSRVRTPPNSSDTDSGPEDMDNDDDA